jgi:hypothetical protein
MESEIETVVMRLKRDKYRKEIRRQNINEIFNSKRVISSELRSNTNNLTNGINLTNANHLSNISNTQIKTIEKITEDLSKAWILKDFEKARFFISEIARIFMIESKNIPIKAAIKGGICPIVAEFLQDYSNSTIFKENYSSALQIVADILSGDTDDVLILVHLNIVDILINILSISTVDEHLNMVFFF